MDNESSSLESCEAKVPPTSNCRYTDATLNATNESDVRAAADVERGARWQKSNPERWKKNVRNNLYTRGENHILSEKKCKKVAEVCDRPEMPRKIC